MLQLLIFGEIGFDITWQDVAAKLKESKAKGIQVQISSGGGSAFDGIAIYNVLRADGRRIEVEIVGLAASAASVIAMAGDHVSIAENAMVMIHNSSSVVMGDAEALRQNADIQAKIDDAMSAAYARKSGRPPEMFRPLMNAETWLSAEEVLAAGLVDEITSARAIAASLSATRSWARIPDLVKAKLQGVTKAAIVASKSMTPEEFRALISEAVAPITARLDKMEASTPVPPAPPDPDEDEPAPDPDEDEGPPPVDVDEPASLEVATAREMFAAAVSAACDNFIAQGKLSNSPEARELFAATASTPKAFKKACAYFAAAPAVVQTAPQKLPALKIGPVATLTPAQLAWAKQARIDPSKWITAEGSD